MSTSDMLFSLFSGRINRAPWWLTFLATLVFFIALLVVDSFFTELRGVMVLLFIPIVLANLAVGARRLHDRNKSGGWILLLYFLPGILQGIADDHSGALYLIFTLPNLAICIWSIVELGVLRGTVGPNNYGPDPLQQATATQPA